EQEKREGWVGVALPTLSPQDRPDEAASQERDQQHGQHEAADPADKGRRAVASAPPAGRERLAFRPPRGAAHRRRPGFRIPASPPASASARPHFSAGSAKR